MGETHTQAQGRASDSTRSNRHDDIPHDHRLMGAGLTLTCMALYGATKSIKAGDRERTNRMFRARVYAQGFTVLAMVIGSIYWKTDRQKRKEYEALLTERNAQAKRDAWIRELEVRDEEERLLKAKRDRRVAAEKYALRGDAREKTDAGEDASSTNKTSLGVLDSVKALGFGGKK